MSKTIKDAISKTAKALEAELQAGKHKGNEQAVKDALEAAKKATGADRPNSDD